MHHPLHPHWDPGSQQGLAGPLLCKASNANDHGDAQQLDRFTEGIVTDLQEPFTLGNWQVSWSQVAATLTDEKQRAVVVDKAVAEEDFGSGAHGTEEAPEAGTTHLRLGALQATDRPLGVLVCWPGHLPTYLEPIPDQLHCSKGDLPKRRTVTHSQGLWGKMLHSRWEN